MIEKIKVSKTMSYLLRHGASKEGIDMNSEGYVDLRQLIDKLRRKFGHGINEDFIRRIVAECKKQRFKIDDSGRTPMIRANQGHTVEDAKGMKMNPILTPKEVIHGTTKNAWKKIQTTGLSRMARNHIHMVTISNREKHRVRADTWISIDVSRAMNEGILFYQSDNGVVLSPGNDDGLIPAKYLTLYEESS